MIEAIEAITLEALYVPLFLKRISTPVLRIFTQIISRSYRLVDYFGYSYPASEVASLF